MGGPGSGSLWGGALVPVILVGKKTCGQPRSSECGGPGGKVQGQLATGRGTRAEARPWV